MSETLSVEGMRDDALKDAKLQRPTRRRHEDMKDNKFNDTRHVSTVIIALPSSKWLTTREESRRSCVVAAGINNEGRSLHWPVVTIYGVLQLLCPTPEQ